jgi:hypothetical protein
MSLPVYAYLIGKGRVRILEYVGNDTFRVLTIHDETVRVQRNRLVFTKQPRVCKIPDCGCDGTWHA